MEKTHSTPTNHQSGGNLPNAVVFIAAVKVVLHQSNVVNLFCFLSSLYLLVWISKKGMRIVSVVADGDCLYDSVCNVEDISFRSLF
ncbi:hypothetical protein J1N35_017023 [Gossypium stocksii]|uniref:OTU domain-containing protein n=1 Tax=Gossypium stocksii TaxID=47602 RepID=A0A9D3VLB8_9ROSI|nr:hypothetical protein J1N35_017023 [Gossypium stocksii]